MKRPTDVLKWDGVSAKDGTQSKKRVPYRRRLNAREEAFKSAPVDALLTMAIVAGQQLGPLGTHIFPVPIWGWAYGKRFTRYIAIPLSDQHAAKWTPEKGIQVFPRRIFDAAYWI